MKEERNIEFERPGVVCNIHGDLAVLTLKSNAFETLTNVEEDRAILDWFDLVEDSPRIKGVLALNENGSFGSNMYNQFLSEASGKEIDINRPEAITKFQKSQIRLIEINMLMNYIRKIVRFKKVLITGLIGEVVTPFFGLSLASDIRYAAEGTKFLLSHVKYSIHPSGALPFFLPRYIGHGRAMEYLLKGGEITAEEAYNFRLINHIFPAENYHEKCIESAKEVIQLGTQYVKITKTLANNFLHELDKYFELESNYLLS
ncbi:MAG: enoyl-CoA hydratase/isomerase family protein [Melioribacteraceae bacterium]|nr:enoyl-CoA hydratase/isomerase family protein [Melioribacteraceae bacterium]